jgi:prepilin-type N-terminal cleavage/methylation domain-containing protein
MRALSPPPSQSPPRGFTLLEILLALVIFGLVTLGILTTFRTAARAYDRSGRTMITLQTMRAVRTALSRDLHSVFLVTETTYGASLPQSERDEGRLGVNTELIEARARAEERGIVDYSLTEMRDVLDEEDFDDPSLTAQLLFRVEDGGDSDTVVLMRRLRSMDTVRAMPWGLVRLSYSVKGEELVRSIEPVFFEERPMVIYPDETVEEAEARHESELVRVEARQETVVDGVTMFDVQCVFWADGAWVSTPEWDSELREQRNPYVDSPIELGDPSYDALTRTVGGLPLDGLPAALEVHLGLRHRVTGRTMSTRMLIPIPPAQETWIPPDERLLEGSVSPRDRGRSG